MRKVAILKQILILFCLAALVALLSFFGFNFGKKGNVAFGVQPAHADVPAGESASGESGSGESGSGESGSGESGSGESGSGCEGSSCG